MSERYFISEQLELLAARQAVLTGAEHQHLTRVMRQKAGDEVLLFDGSGREFTAIIDSVGRNQTELSIIRAEELSNEPDLDLTMAVALPKGDRQKWLIEKLTELGVRRYIPLRTTRSDIQADENVLVRLRRQVIEASKQCGRLCLMEILPEQTRREAAASQPDETFCILAHPICDGDFGQWNFMQFLEKFQQEAKTPKKMLITIGPVGGLTQEEVQEAVNDGWPTLDLGKQVYRVETAAIVAASLFLHL